MAGWPGRALTSRLAAVGFCATHCIPVATPGAGLLVASCWETEAMKRELRWGGGGEGKDPGDRAGHLLPVKGGSGPGGWGACRAGGDKCKLWPFPLPLAS